MKTQMLTELLSSVGVAAELLQRIDLSITGDDSLPSCFNTTEFASSSLMSAGCALLEFVCAGKHGDDLLVAENIRRINVDNRFASLWFKKSLFPLDWQPSAAWDSIAGDYRCADGWIRLHTNAPHHKLAAIKVLQCAEGRQDVANALNQWQADELEAAIVDAGGCAATMRSIDAWQQHPQGIAVASEPLIHWSTVGNVEACVSSAPTHRPLADIKVLDLTRVLAGPVSTRFLAAYGADVLRIDPIDWDEPSLVPEVTLGKRCAHLDLKNAADRDRFLALVKSADVLVHGYRPGAMANLGLDEQVLLECNPALINVCLCAYGWSGPWSGRRGFDSLVQMSSGIAHEGMLQFNADKPHPLPVQALDHATGYLMAAATLHALAQRRRHGTVMNAKLSLARTAHCLQQYRAQTFPASFTGVQPSDLNADIEITPWGQVKRVNFPVEIDGIPARWGRPAGHLRSMPAQWQ